MKTKAVVFPEANKFEVREITLPELEPEDILVRTLVTAISPGTERWFLRGKHLGTEFPLIPGYHRIGIVEKRGDAVTEFEVGDIVYGSGGKWEEDIQCQFGAHVGYSVADSAGYDFVASKMPTKFELETLAFTILIGVANRGIRALEPQATETMVIVGGGIIGICAAQLAMLEGAVPVIIEKDPERLDFIKRIVPNVVSPDDPEFVEKLKETAPAGFDYLYDSVGHAPTTDRLVQLMRNHATMMMQAQYFDKEKCAVDLDQIKIKEITIKTTCGIDAKDRLDTVENILTRRLKVASLITHRFNSDEILKGYELLDSGKPFNLGIVFHWSE
jgi:2-desacetyl-2-hydroxyethyl bacteriochlorophyllide A dehydrogenase